MLVGIKVVIFKIVQLEKIKVMVTEAAGGRALHNPLTDSHFILVVYSVSF